MAVMIVFSQAGAPESAIWASVMLSWKQSAQGGGGAGVVLALDLAAGQAVGALGGVDRAVGAGDVDGQGVVDGARGQLGLGDEAGEGGEAGGGAAAAQSGAEVGSGGNLGAGPDVERPVVSRPAGVLEVVFDLVGLVDDGHVRV